MKIGLIVAILGAVFMNTVFGFTCGLGNYACLASCIGQHCASGYCVGSGPPITQICTCTNCGIQLPFPKPK